MSEWLIAVAGFARRAWLQLLAVFAVSAVFQVALLVTAQRRITTRLLLNQQHMVESVQNLDAELLQWSIAISDLNGAV